MLSEEQIYKACIKGDSKAQKALYSQYSQIVRSVCRRYIADDDEAEDILQETFIKVFTKIETFEWKGKGTLGGWIKRIAVNASINAYKKQKIKGTAVSIDDYELESPEETEFTADDTNSKNVSLDVLQAAELNQNELMGLLAIVPPQFRMVFNLYVVEGMSHKEIGELLSIEEKTSRTRLLRARKILQKAVVQLCVEKMVV